MKDFLVNLYRSCVEEVYEYEADIEKAPMSKRRLNKSSLQLEGICGHCQRLYQPSIVSETDQWGVTYAICPHCQRIGRFIDTHTCEIPSNDIQEFKHALQLFQQNGHQLD